MIIHVLRGAFPALVRSAAIAVVSLAAMAALPAQAARIITTADSAGVVGLHNSLQLNGGNPVVAYYDITNTTTNADLKVATCTAGCATASPTWMAVTVDNVGQMADALSLQLNGNNPVVAYGRRAPGILKLATCTADCDTATPTWVIVTVDTVGQLGDGLSLQLNGGNPVVSYRDTSTGGLKLATCITACASDTPIWVITVVDSGDTGQWSSLKLNGGNPVISYHDMANGRLKLATCMDDCATSAPNWAITTVDSVPGVGMNTSLALNGGNPVVSYYNIGNETLKLATCIAAPCAGATPDWVITTVDTMGFQPDYAVSSLQLNGGSPVISYHDRGSRDLKLAVCTANCATAAPTWVITTVDGATAQVGEFNSLALNGGLPVVSYNDNLSGELKVATFVPAAVTTVGVPANGTYVIGQNLDFTLNFGENVVVDATGGTPSLPLVIGSAPVNAAYVSGSGTSALTFRYTVQFGDEDADGVVLGPNVALNGGTLRDTFGNSATLALNGVPSTAGVLVHTVAAVTSVAVPANGTYTGGQILDFTVSFTDNVIVDTAGGTPSVPLTIGAIARDAAYVSGSASSALLFRYVVQIGDVDIDGVALGSAIALNGGAIRDTSTNNATLTLNGVPSTAGVLINAPITFTVTPSAGANGSITPNTPQTIVSGDTTTFTVTPSAGYSAVVGGTCGGALVGTTYTTNAITASCTVAATFTQITFTVTPSAGANGTISPNTPQTIASGATTTFTVTPSAGYTAAVGGTCGGALVGNTYTTNAITANCTVAASFTQVTFTVTPSAGANGTISPNTPQTIASGATTTFTVTPSAGYNATVGGSCGGTLVGDTYTTNAITANCTVVASFASGAVTTFSGPSATGSGTITASFTGGGPACTYATSEFIPLTGHARSPPAGSAPAVTFPHGLFDFSLSGCTPGSTVAFTITYPTALGAGTRYYKYGPTPDNTAPHWYVLPTTIAGNTATFSITDGALGDDDLAANGAIVDQGGPGDPGGAGLRQVPTLSEWALLLMAALMMMTAMADKRRIRKGKK